MSRYTSKRYIDHTGICLVHIQERKRYRQFIFYKDYTNAILNECKREHNYDNAERVLDHLIEHMGDTFKRYTDEEINSFQTAVLTLIRYAPSLQKALDYTGYLLEQEPPLRTELMLMKCLSSLILIFKREHLPDSMDKALRVIKIVFACRFHITDNQGMNVADVFVTVSQDVLKYHFFMFSLDLTQLVAIK